MGLWKAAKKREISPKEFRRDYICARTIALKAIGEVGKLPLIKEPDHSKWSNYMAFLNEIEWSKTIPELQVLVIAKGHISSSHNNQKAFGEYLIEKSGLQK